MSTLLQLRDRCKEESDNVNSSFVSDAEWNKYINNSYGELYSLLAQSFGADYFVATPAPITTDGVNQLFPLASDFFKLLGVEVQVSSPAQWVSLKPFAFADRNQVSLFNTQIPQAGQSVRYWYIPRVTALAADGTSTVDAISINGWDEYIVADACIKALAKEESDVSVFMTRKTALVTRLEAEVSNRDAGNPARIVDVLGKRARSMQYRLNGSNLWLIGSASPGWYYDAGDWGGDSDDFGSW